MAEIKKTVLSFKKDTPTWVKWTYRIIFGLTGAATLIVTTDPSIPAAFKISMLVWMKALDTFAYSIGQGIGVNKYEKE